jgi:hypothetical protein
VDAGTAALLGAAISGVVVLASQVIGSWLAASHHRKQSNNERLVRFMASAKGYTMAVGLLARSEEDRKEALERELIWTYMDSVDAALVEIRVHNPGQVADAAVAVDVALGELIGEAREKQFSREGWRKARDLIITKPMDHLVVRR